MFQSLKRLGPFSIVRVLGRGGMGVVYLADDERLGRPVALKVLDIYDVPDQEQKARFLREARAAAAIRHPNVATIYDVGETPEGFPYLAMEYCEGATLAQLIRRGPVTTEQFMSIARQITDGIAAAHRNGVVHRDIKSANIVLQDDGTIKILDFGLAKRFDINQSQSATARFTSSGSMFFGTLPYIAPEQAGGRAADQRSDLFSLGVVLYELATGKLPFDDDSPILLLEKIRNAEPAPFQPAEATFPPAAAGIISTLLQKSPDDRYQRAEELADDLRRIQPTSAIPSTSRHATTRQFGKTVRRNALRPAIVTVSMIVAVVAIAVAGAVFLSMRRTKSERANAPVVTGPIRSLAVLPFRNLSQNSSDSFLSVGLADALVTKLQQIPELHVRPTSAVLAIQKDNFDMKEAADHLEVDGVLEGQILSSGDQVRISLQLTDARTGYGVWASSIDGRRDNLILLMDQVSAKTATALNQKFGTTVSTGRSQPSTKVPEAYEEYLKARALVGSLVPEDSAKQVESLKRATELDPSFAAAYAELAIALSLRNVRGFVNEENEYREPEWYARQAVRLDPNLPEAHLALGRALVRVPERFRESVRENLAALRLNSTDLQALYTLATYFVSRGEPEKTACVGELMKSIDPGSNDVRARGYWNVNSVDPEGSLEMSKIALQYPQTRLAGHDIAAMGYLMLDNIDAAEVEQKKASALVPTHYIGKSLAAMIAAARGDAASADKHVASFTRDAEVNHWAALRVALTYAKLGRRDEAVKWISAAARLGNHNWYYLVKHPWLQPLQGSAEFQQVLAKMKGELDDVRDDVIGIYDLICRRKGLAT